MYILWEQCSVYTPCYDAEILTTESKCTDFSFSFLVSSCGYPGSPSHAVVTFTPENVRPGTVASYECEPGFELLGPSRRLCSSNGTWTPAGIPFCGKIKILYSLFFFYLITTDLSLQCQWPFRLRVGGSLCLIHL